MTLQDQHNRKLAAILFADIQGYTALMQKGEGNAMKILNRYEEICASSVKEHNGEIVKKYGDGSLILFENTVDAARSAIQMQLEFQKDPVVPLRIGIHVGEVVHKDQDVFGNSVNITARLESVGKPGAVLLSESAEEKIRNQEEFTTLSLGEFKFKNVKETVEIFALSNEGLVIPKKSDLQKSIKARLKKKWYEKPAFRVLSVFLLLLLASGIFFMQDILALGDSNTITSENKEKRIAVLQFDNQTNDIDLESFGNMLSDWITRGLMETNESNIVNSANLQHLFGELKSGTQLNPDFSLRSGIDLLLQGRYYYVEGQLFVNAEILNIASGEVIKTFQVEGERTEHIKLLDAISDEIMSYWAVKDHAQFSQNPPKYEAYEEFLKGMSVYTKNAGEAISYMENSFNIDSSFYPALFRIWALYSNLGQFDKAKEVRDLLSSKKENFTKFEGLRFESIVAQNEHRFLEAAKLNEQKFRMDPSDVRSNYSAAFLYISANYPENTLSTLEQLDLRLSDNNEGFYGWRLTLEAYANVSLGNLESAHNLISQTHLTRMPRALADFHMMSLLRMDSIELVADYYQKYSDQGTYEFTGMRSTSDQLLVNICNELMISNKIELLKEYAQKMKLWLTTNKVTEFSHDKTDIWNNVPFRQEESQGYASFFLGEIENAIGFWEQEEIPTTNWPDILERASRIGHCYGLIGDTINANLQLQLIESISDKSLEFPSQQAYYKSRILSSLGKNSEAISSIKNAFDNGFSYFRIYTLDRDPFLIQIMNEPPFKEIVKPKSTL